MASQILLYSGPGTSSFCVQALENQLRDSCDDRIYSVARINSFNSLVSTADLKSIKAVFVPGGYAPAMWIYDLEPNSAQVKTILDEYGISYYGVCAGGIVAARSVCYRLSSSIINNGFKDKENLKGTLDLFPARVIAPMLPKSGAPLSATGQLNFKDLQIVNIGLIQEGSSVSLDSLYILGPGYIKEAGVDERIQTLATYNIPLPSFNLVELETGSSSLGVRNCRVLNRVNPTDVLESIYYKSPRGSKLLVTATHVEVDSVAVLSESFKEIAVMTNAEQKKMSDNLKPSDQQRKDLLKRNFEKIGIVCKEA